MALINNIYILAEEENVENNVTTVTHPTESGMPNADTIRRKAIIIRIKGVIADTEKVKAETAIAKIGALQKEGSKIKYIGACGTYSNLQIQTFTPSFTHKVNGGAKYDMTLQEMRTAKSAYVKPKTVTSTKTKLSVGDTVYFRGGAVYRSSDAKKVAVTRGASTCKLTLISTLKGATHIYHLISKDGKGVYGWVDASAVSAVTTTAASSSSAGTQQVNSSFDKSVFHTVKKGDTVWNLVNVKYKSTNATVAEVIEDNSKAFSRPGDPTSLQIGARICIKG